MCDWLYDSPFGYTIAEEYYRNLTKERADLRPAECQEKGRHSLENGGSCTGQGTEVKVLINALLLP